MTDGAGNPQSMATCCAGQNTASSHNPLGADSQDMTLGGLLQALEATRGASLSFVYEGRQTRPGYHVTEMKYARMTSVDCGGNPESWTETIFQIWDIEVSVTGQTMAIDKLLGIIRKVTPLIGADDASRLTFEVSDGEVAMRTYAFDRLDITESGAVIHLGPRVSACKPLVRGILPEAGVKGACGPKVAFANLDKKPPCCS